MVWPVPAAKSIFSRLAAASEVILIGLFPNGDVKKISRAVRSVHGMFAVIWSAVAPEVRETHDHIAWWGRQYMPDSADDEAMIMRHASIWGTDPRDATKAIGSVTIEGVAGTVLASGIVLASTASSTYVTTAGGTIAAGGTVTVTAEAGTAGSAGNLETGVQLSTVAAFPEISKVTVATAFAGGTDDEEPESVQERYLQRIREPPMGGSAPDYRAWVGKVANVYAVKVVEDWIGRGSVGLVIALKNDDGTPRVPTELELTAIGNYIGAQGSQTGVRPVTARVIPLAAELVNIPVSVRLRPDGALTRAAVQSAFDRFIATIGDEDDMQNESPIGATIEPSRISEAISAADGEYSHDLTIPSVRYTLGVKACPVATAITWLN
ncbi:baseplate J/gp47 family protein [Agrobacterium tumefaciens]|uniref:baseplate J/gp47 family protein n=1 Tax=Agrobacterium tumefaciens TaxID=358 RepID=UPI00080F972D|nr:baseplate J/gp47 family protein [Agrobacterium tumefaciens]NSL22361.1 baseplate J/gp47 family protein [Agrobacterium tumefaciens]NTC57252.1 baseplate J/gp47 family protein [Agrobacterium tumefaciens]NTC62094.1 baseplate J/gp47 family protein [Agrobacterium tumefaciens]NTC65824.1 baseplate J/gp47 family protein [Agrobacterium tumefaciens]NTC74404.1 baseplate J/gp47 family protein [Agrobacterium tumefaciens]